jgi:ParB family transcriptional regulator, chromosome partitioning protein
MTASKTDAPVPMPVPIPVTEIDAEALPRDRAALDPGALAELRASILATGLRQPIEVFEAEPAPDTAPYGLISGLRRLTVFRELASDPRFATIPAFVRAPRDAVEAMAAMIAENEIRADLTPWERGRIVVEARDAGFFPTLDAAVSGLYPALDRNRRARIRATADVVDALDDGLLTDPRMLSQRQLVRLATALRHGMGEVMAHALTAARDTSPEAQWRTLERIIAEAEEDDRTPTCQPDPRPGRPRRLVRVRRTLAIRRERLPEGWSLRFTGPDATGPMMEDIMDHVESMFGRTA